MSGRRADSRMARLLLRVYPTRVRERRGSEILSFWQMQRDEPRYAGRLGSVRFVLAVLRDALVSGLRARFGRQWRAAHEDRSRRGRWRAGIVATTGMDVRQALRSLRNAPSYTVVAALTLALGIGATTSLFSIVNGVLLRALPYREPERLVSVSRITGDGDTDTVAWPDFRDWREQASGFSGMAAWAEATGTFGWDDGAESLEGAYVTRDMFGVLGIPLAKGRTFDEAEDVSGGANAIILSDGLWRSRFGGDRDIIGRTIVVDDESVSIVGVAPAGFVFPGMDAVFFRPLQGDQLLADVGLPTNSRSMGFLRVIGRLGGSDAAGVEESLGALAARIDEETGRTFRSGVRIVQLRESIVGDVASTLLFLLAAVVLVLIGASANVAGLSLSRANARRREMAVRTALGAGGGRLFRQLMTESIVLSMLAGVLGMFLGWALTQVMRRLVPPGLPRIGEIRTDGVVLAFSALVTLLTGLVLGLVPAIRAARTDVASGLAISSRGSSGSPTSIRPQQLLVAGQVAVSVVLLAAAALLSNSFIRLMRSDRGFESEGVVMALVVPSGARYGEPARIDAFYSTLLERIRALPGVLGATSTYSPPLASNDFSTAIWKVDEEGEADRRHWVGTVIVRDDYFETTGVPLLSGRDFDASDRLDTPPVVIVSEAMARGLWPGENAIGKQFVFAGGLEGSADSFDPAFFPREPYTVVGIAGDVRRNSLAEEPRPEYYRPHSQITWGSQYLLVRATGRTDGVAGLVRDVVHELDASVPIPIMRTLDSQIAESVATPRFRMLVLAGFAIITCMLAMVGLYAVMVLAVQRRTREMGIRLALGARSGQIMRGVLEQGLVLVAAGILGGIIVAYSASSLLVSMLYQVAPTDPATYGIIVLATGLVALLACYLPARRASRVDPVVSLQQE
jgi:putative ABC transport system permease protein